MSDGSTSASSASSRAGSLGSRRKFYNGSSSKSKSKSKGKGKKHVSKELQTLRRKSMNRGFLQTLANKKRMLPAGATASLSRDTSGKHHDYGDEDDDDHENENEEDGDDGTETEIDSEDDDSNDEDDASDMDDDDDDGDDAVEGSDGGDEDDGDSKGEQQQSDKDKDRDSSLAPFARAFGRKLSRREAARRQELFQRISLLNRIKRKRKRINDPVISQQLSDEDLRLMPTEKLQELDLEITYHENSHKKVQSWRSYILLGTKILEEIWRSLPEETKEHFDLQDLSKELFFNINTFDDDLYDVYDYYGFQPSHPVMALAQSYMKFVGVFTYTRMMSKQTMSAATAAAPSGSVPHDPAAAMHNGMRVPNPAGPDATGAHANANVNPSLSSGGAPAPNDQSASGLFTPSSSQPHGTTSSFPNLQRLRDQARRRRQLQQQQQEQQGPQQQQQPAAPASASAPSSSLTPRPGYLPPPPNAPSVRGPVSLSTARADEQRSSSSRDTQPHTQQAKTVTFE